MISESLHSAAVTSTLHLTNQSALTQRPTVGAIEGGDLVFFSQAAAAPESIEAGASADVPFTFTPTAERAYAATLNLRRAATCPQASTQLIGSASNDVLEWSPTLLDFGKLPLGASLERAITFTNRTSLPLNLSNAKVSGLGFVLLSASSLPLAAKGSGSLTLKCIVNALGVHDGELELEVNTEPVRSIRVPLKCTGGGPRIRTVPATDLSFGQVAYTGSSAPLTTTRRLTVQNTGTLPQSEGETSSNLFLGKSGKPPFVFIEPANGQTSASEFTVSVLSWNSEKGLPATPGKNSVDFDVHFTPRSADDKRAKLTIYSNDALQPAVTVMLTGSAKKVGYCALSVEPSVLSFGDLPVGTALQKSVELINTSNQPCLISGIEIAPGSDPMFSTSSNSSLVVPPMNRLPLMVVVNTPPAAIEGESHSGYLRFQVNPTTIPNVLVPLGVRIAPCLVASPEVLEFGNVKVGCRASAKAITLYNACSQDIMLDAIEISPQPSDFTISAAPVVPAEGLALEPGVPQPMQVVFAPTTYAPHTSEAVFSVTEAGVSKKIRVALRGVGAMNNINVDTFTQPLQTPADLLFVVDNSCSMYDKQNSLATNFSSFIAYANQLKVPYQIGVTTTDDGPFGDQGQLRRSTSNPMLLTPTTPNVATRFSEKVNVGTNGSGLEQPLSAALKAVTAPLITGANRGFLRPDASLSIIIVSDAPDQSSAPASYYLNRFMSLVPRNKAWLFTFSTIGPFTSPLPVGCTIDTGIDVGRYEPIITASSGIQADICTQDWARDLEAIGRNALGPRSTLFLTAAPDLAEPVTVTVNGRAVRDFTVDPVTNAVTINTTSTPPGATIEVNYATACF